MPSAVRSLLPSKPYQPPEANPLPGASTEPDCCSICLVDLEAGEDVTVLPCMHFYHKVRRGGWRREVDGWRMGWVLGLAAPSVHSQDLSEPPALVLLCSAHTLT